ncbi:hypothetical protein FJT64_005049 [Amphibalanus amphitrite]|uniref:Uncharacterized protein n=1 Tax=Amphibalanus amphitrite TaxID=1232801 RepID=A0A6A4VMS1_AMPAM|nr:hypothetical protein FJT64_005049 [Amphibalanus amphitrite]
MGSSAAAGPAVPSTTPERRAQHVEMGRNIVLSTGSTVLALVAAVVGIITVATPYWASFENRIDLCDPARVSRSEKNAGKMAAGCAR